MTLGATTLSQGGPKNDGNKGYPAFPKDSALLETYNQII